MLDPSLPENLDEVAPDIRRLRAWGYQLIKHDFHHRRYSRPLGL
jgi:alpha-galactosidase